MCVCVYVCVCVCACVRACMHACVSMRGVCVCTGDGMVSVATACDCYRRRLARRRAENLGHPISFMRQLLPNKLPGTNEDNIEGNLLNLLFACTWYMRVCVCIYIYRDD